MPVTKEEKISFLKKLAKGEATIKSLLPVSLGIRVGYPEGTTFHVNDKQVEKAEFDDYWTNSRKKLKVTYGDKLDKI